ncbi:hypothetical protein [Ruminococcus champanellensis]
MPKEKTVRRMLYGTVQLCFGVSAGDWLLAGAELSDGERVRIQQGV